MYTKIRPTGKLMTISKKLFKQAIKYHMAYQDMITRTPVIWVQADDGTLVIITRGEYAEPLKHFVESLRNPQTLSDSR